MPAQQGFDERLLLKLRLQIQMLPEQLECIPGIELISQEGSEVVIAFATVGALETFEARLRTMETGERPTRAEVLYALGGFDQWSADDRTGWALRQRGWPGDDEFLLDIELWPLGGEAPREQMVNDFVGRLEQAEVMILDRIQQPGLVVFRVRLNRNQADEILQLRDVRTVDRLPNFGLERRLLTLDIQNIPQVQAPDNDAPGVVVLDTGITTGHPLLGPAVGDAQSFRLEDDDAGDEHGHGTLVAGIALYNDVEASAQAGRFVPELRLFSGKVLDDNNEGDPRFIENQIIEAVDYFVGNYQCKVFCLSYGDGNKPYLGGHVRGLAFTLDRLARERGILFVVPSGNYGGHGELPADWREDYPSYLGAEGSEILDPAPALNVLTVGSIARWDRTYSSQYYETDPAEIPIAQRNQPSPFSRAGGSVSGALKPELVDYGGNWAIQGRAGGHVLPNSLPELSTSKDFAAGRLLSADAGTSFAAPHVAHLAARVLRDMPDADANLLRALLVSHARVPGTASDLLEGNAARIRHICGYGKIEDDALFASVEDSLTLWASDSILNKTHHFYDIPIPESLFAAGSNRRREITIALAHTPPTRTTRIDYKASRIRFRLIQSGTLEDATAAFNAATNEEEWENISELSGNKSISDRDRSKGTVQSTTWIMRRPSSRHRANGLYLVVTRHDPAWGEAIADETEAYSIVITMRDREAENAQLYTQVRAILRARQRVRGLFV